ncbi:hypothetical protein LTR56_025225 [Elasticomyces elasticus]|nr:hypothetical protein LTR56_025225 [Elasticomyces elasticus]KAK3623147.1 hypothetical protein LTR22_024510 [Elasticomyces elasticus]KAK5756034.1 hypothetical protein LTS12_013923 [Elasticomyces elasticus]
MQDQARSQSPSHSRPPSPHKHTSTIRPGPNAFAQQAARMERHRFDGNAFYQQEVQKRTITPPSSIHPALREQSTSNDLRESSITTMSDFINAGKKPSPPLSFMPSNGQFAEPTRRGYIEERREQMIHEASGSDEDRTPVYQTFSPTPKVPSSEFASSKPSGSATPRKHRISLPRRDINLSGETALKSPKKTFFDKLRITKFGGSTPSPSMTTLNSSESFVIEEAGIPVKAQAVLGTSPSRLTITRSPSKQKKASFMSRKAAQVSDLASTSLSMSSRTGSTYTQSAPRTGSTQVTTPQTAETSLSDPTHYSYINGKRIPSQTLSDRGGYHNQGANKCAIQRSQSLKYFDPGVPPTPPAKNTPPGQKAQKAVSTSARVPFHQIESTPSNAPAGLVSTSDRVSPTKFGSYGHKETPRLVTKPSIYSLHASVVPSNMEATTFEEMKARIDGLGLEGFNMPHETQYRHQPSPEMVYSPSIYSGEWSVRNSVMSSRHGHRLSLNELPSLAEAPNERESSGHRSKDSSSTSATIDVYYPEYLSDPNRYDLTTQHKCHIRSHTSPDVRTNIREELQAPSHGRTHARDHSNSPVHSMAIEEDNPLDAIKGDKVPVCLFAMPSQENMAGCHDASPTPSYHPSLMPSPLHYLPATTYTPPPKTSRKRMDDITPVPQRWNGAHDGRNSGLGLQSEASLLDLPVHDHETLDAPILTATPRRRDSAGEQVIIHDFVEAGKENVDPTRSGPTEQGKSTPNKMDEMLAMLGKLAARNEDVGAIREEMRNSNARLDARLAAMENIQHNSSSPNSSHVGVSLDGASSMGEGRPHSRIPTDVARDFYRLGQSPGPASSPPTSMIGGSVGEAETEAERIDKLTEENKQMTAMVQGFAAELEAIKKKIGGSA